ncbi:unnamed protein product [Euphydryas editha]|uniref:Uncharacterized protein n=1 Tax=Euphydryas editha TaxID=104508 RepID=A0AAU9VCJ9_EUPED|nr:unnamed protein product [Euphydryas editha]
MKYECHKKYKTSKSQSEYEEFSRYRTIVKAKTALAHDHLASDPKAFWNFIKSNKRNSMYNAEPARLDVSAISAAVVGDARVHLVRLETEDVHCALARRRKEIGGSGWITTFHPQRLPLHVEETVTFPDRWKLTKVVSVA